jgi:hypothetical protein
MASYFDEHNCEPLGPNESLNNFVELARLLLDTGFSDQWLTQWQQMSDNERKPPASKEFVKSLPKVNEFSSCEKCCICLREFVVNQTLRLPCNHKYHINCINPWLEIHNSCPLCRVEFPTDDLEYERNKKEKLRKEALIKELHDSMFG